MISKLASLSESLGRATETRRGFIGRAASVGFALAAGLATFTTADAIEAAATCSGCYPPCGQFCNYYSSSYCNWYDGCSGGCGPNYNYYAGGCWSTGHGYCCDCWCPGNQGSSSCWGSGSHTGQFQCGCQVSGTRKAA